MTRFVSFILSFLFTFFSIAQESSLKIEKDGQFYSIEERMQFHKINGLSYIIVENFEIKEIAYKGFRDKENQLPVDENTLFQLGSMTGAVTKFAIMRLVNEERIALDEAANTYLTSWKIKEKSFTKVNPITIRDLLTQTRGLNDIYKPKGYSKDAPLPTLVQILDGKKPSNLGAMTLKKDRNESGNSSMANMMILQQVLEDVHGTSFAQIVQKEVFEVLDMNKSLIRASLSTKEAKNAAIGYSEEGKRVEGGHLVYPELAVGGLWSTPEDYAKLVLHIFKAVRGMDNRFLSQELAKASIHPEEGSHSLILLKNGYSYWGGAPEGFYSQFSGDVDQGSFVMGASNKHLCWRFINMEFTPTVQNKLQKDPSR